MLNSFSKVHELACAGWKIGQKVKVEVQLVKDYGLIVAVDSTFTGFIVNDQTSSKKEYKAGQSIEAIVLDVDYDKKIIDLSEKLVSAKS